MQALTHNLLEKVFTKMDVKKTNKLLMKKLSMVCKRFTVYTSEYYWDTTEVKDIKLMLKKRDTLIIDQDYGYSLIKIEEKIREAVSALIDSDEVAYCKYENYVLNLLHHNTSFSGIKCLFGDFHGDNVGCHYFDRFYPQLYYGVALPLAEDDLDDIFESFNFSPSATSYCISAVWQKFKYFDYFYKYVKNVENFESLFYESERDKAAEFIEELKKTGHPLDSHAKYICEGYRNNGIEYFDRDDYETDKYTYESTKHLEVDDEFPELTYEFHLADDELERVFAGEVY